MKALRLLFLMFIGGALAIATLRQRGETHVLRAELALAGMERDEFDRLRQTRRRLQSQAPSDSRLAHLREEQAAIRRLRNELESLKKPSPPP